MKTSRIRHLVRARALRMLVLCCVGRSWKGWDRALWARVPSFPARRAPSLRAPRTGNFGRRRMRGSDPRALVARDGYHAMLVR